MADLDTLVSQFIDEWNDGRRPSLADWLNRAEETDRDELRRQLGAFLAVAPTPRYDASAIDELLKSPTVEVAAEAFEAERGAWPTLLPRLRAQTGLSLRELAERVLASAGVTGGDVAKAAGHLGGMESGRLEATVVSTRVVEVVGRILGVRARDLVQAGTPAAAPAGGALFRRESAEAAGADLDLLADALSTPAPASEWDEVDKLFFGRPDCPGRPSRPGKHLT